MSQTGGGYLLDLYTAIRTADEGGQREMFRTKLKEFVDLVDSYGEPFDGHQSLLQILLRHNEDFELLQKGDTTRRDLAVYLYHKYDEYKKGLITELPQPEPVPLAEDSEMAQLQREVQAALDAKGEETRQCQEALAAAQARLQEVLGQKEEDKLLLAEKVRELEIWEGNVQVTEDIILSKETEIQTLREINKTLSAEDSEKEAAISKLIQLERETAKQALALQQKLSTETAGLQDAKYLVVTYIRQIKELESAFKALNLPDRPSNQALAELRREISQLKPDSLDPGLLLQSLQEDSPPRTIKEELAYNERQRERLVTDLKTLRTAYLAKCVELSTKVQEVQELQGKLGNALADAHVNMQLYKTQLDKNAQLKSANVSLSEKVGDLEKEQAELEESKTLIERKVQQKLSDLEGSLAEARAAYSKVKQNPPETNVQFSDFLSVGGMLLFLLETKSALLTDSEDETLAREITDVQTELGDIEMRAKEKLKECDDLVKTNSILLGRIQALQEQVGGSVDFLRQGIQLVRDENTSTQRLIERITAQPEDSAEVQALRAQLAALTNSGPALQQQLQQVQQQIQALGQGIQAQQAAAGGNPQQIQASLQQYTASVQQYQELQAQAQAATGRAAALQASVSQFEARLADCERRVGQKEGERAAASAAATTLQQRLGQLTAEKTVVDQARLEAERQKAVLEGQMRSAAAVVAAAQQRATGAEQRERDLNQRLERERNPVNIQQLQGVLQGLVVQRQQIEQERQNALERQQGLEQRVMAAEGANAQYAVHSANLTGELGRQQEAYNTVQAQAQAAIQQATAQARQEAAAALAAQTAQAEQFEARLQAAVQAAVAGAQAQAIATQGARDAQHNEALAALMLQLEQRGGEIRRIQEEAVAARAAATAAATEAQRAAVAAETIRATGVENQRLRDRIQIVGAQIAQSELPGGVMVEPPMGTFELALYTSINAAKQRQRLVGQREIQQRQAIIDWHTGVQVEFNPPLAGPPLVNTPLTFTLRNRGVHAIAFFRYPEGTDYIDVHDDIPKTHIVRPNLQGYGAFNVN